ncbi:Alpha/beta hydrolase family protein [Pseudovibrio axinellae]|uniref:Alpha/beta hydrolase family protein n=1 Tax=Pseudovibrio axinellae TaxID=989403 RepID=A0A165XIB5_9HYPH|nr:alpha/beta hydrolase [Pseudovibrio axinellae]KZL17728.1 Alpha/beta hydrolase family protein [Pseudovibrio axinellae]SER42091.1 alpha/beta hydrolase fold [Pseudovibrio axinellae]
MRDWDAAYHNSGAVPNAGELFDQWVERSKAFRASSKNRLDIAYGSGEREKLDLFFPKETAPKGVVLIVHGGYWKAFDKSSFSHLAKGAVEMGYAVAVPSYDLCPHAKISNISNQMQAALEVVAEIVEGPIYLTGHSAGGHLVARLGCENRNLPDTVGQRIKHILGISGVYDLRPIRLTQMNETLQIDAEEARLESPVLHDPLENLVFTGWVGADELTEFRRQNAAHCAVWEGFETKIAAYEDPGKNHFTVVEGLEVAHSPILTTLFNT